MIDKRCYYCVTTEALKVKIKHFFRKNLFACLHEVISSFHLFREANSGLQRYFSQRHRLHWFELGYMGQLALKSFKWLWTLIYCQSHLEAAPYNPASNRCNLCLWEEYFIICRPELASLNKQSELIRELHVDVQTNFSWKMLNDAFQSVMRSLSTLIFINISLSRWNANRCYSLRAIYLIFEVNFPISFIDFHSCEVVSSSDMRKNEA